MTVVQVSYFSDALCIWAYAGQARINAVAEKFGNAVRLDHRFCSVFGDTARKIASAWKDKGEYVGFNSHLRSVAQKFPPAKLVEFLRFKQANAAEDKDGNPVYLAQSEWFLNTEISNNPDIVFHFTSEIHK